MNDINNEHSSLAYHREETAAAPLLTIKERKIAHDAEDNLVLSIFRAQDVNSHKTNSFRERKYKTK